MGLTDENRIETTCQLTHHAMLVPWGRFSRHMKLSLFSALFQSNREQTSPT